MNPLKGINTHTIICNLFLVILNIQEFSNTACGLAGSSVKFLPGFDGQLPFELETGYIGVGESEDVQLFYYFIKSENNPIKDPLMLWFSGGPGCSGFSALIYEIGPVKFELVQYYKEVLPKLVLNPYSWTKVASIIFLDLPVGAGFSYGRNTKAAQSDVLQSSNHASEFLRKWLIDHLQFISNQVYIGGDSYSGIMVPIITQFISDGKVLCTQFISDGNGIGLEPRIDLKGYVLGNPKTSPIDREYIVPYAHGMGLISDELFESLKESCGGIYHDIDPKNSLCLQNMNNFIKLVRYVNEEHILESKCMHISRPTKSLGEIHQMNIKRVDTSYVEEGYPIKCRADGYKLSHFWANDENVQKAIHIHEGTINEWKRCKLDLPFIKSITNSVPYHANLSIKGYRSLIYSGDHDSVITFISTEAWIRSLNYSIIDDWRPWMIDDQVVGYTRTYANKMTFATVKHVVITTRDHGSLPFIYLVIEKGGGHNAPEYKLLECMEMFKRWMSYEPL